jgi:cephalosporin hydroxylase
MNMDPIKQFKLERQKRIKSYSQDKKLKRLSLEWIKQGFLKKYPYNYEWLGRPIIQYPNDMFAMQEIIWKVKPDLIIETGIAHGGGLIFYASMLELIGGGEVLGIDIDIREHNRKEIEKHKMFKRIKMIEGSSVDEKVIKEVDKIVKKHKKVIVCLDSLHTHDHVLAELNLYSKFISKGSYIIAFDTIIEYLPKGFFADRPWDKGNNPATAVKAFLKKNKNFVVDKDIENKLLITSTPGGYLKRVK